MTWTQWLSLALITVMAIKLIYDKNKAIEERDLAVDAIVALLELPKEET